MSEEYVAKARLLLEEHPNFVVSVTWCPDCHYAHKVWADLGITDQIHTVEFDKIADQEEANKLREGFIAIAGLKSYPTIFLGGKVFGGDKKLAQSNKEGTLKEELVEFGIKF